MSFTSYAQNFEDVMLWRALKHIEHGCYVDVGAQHPVIDSVSKAFYEHGWRGIHIEPVPEYAEALRLDRPDETVLQVALSDTEGTLELNVIQDTGLTTAVEAYAQRHQAERGFEYHPLQVPVLTLKSAMKSLTNKDVHWLKIDVEGFEEKVLKGWDSKKFRPWIMVVEATIPNSPVTDYASWDPIITAAGYKFVYFDGLNRFYVANEHAELAEAFSSPPNVFDGVQLSGLASSSFCGKLIAEQHAKEINLATQAQVHAEWLQNEWDAAKQSATSLNAELGTANEHNTQLQAHAQWLQNEWDTAQRRVEELSQHTGRMETELAVEQQNAATLTVELGTANEHNKQLQAHAQWLQSEQVTAQQRIEELSQRTGRLETELIAEQKKTASLTAELGTANEHHVQLQAHAQWMQSARDAAQHRIDWLNQHTSRLESELATELQKTANLTAELGTANERHIQLQAHDQWLQNEWDATKVKVNELNHSSHHWWTVADGLNRELQNIYASKVWRITWPLRKTMLAAKWSLALPSRAVRWALRQPKGLAKPLVVWSMRKTLANPELKARAQNVLIKHPKIKQHLRLLAVRSGLIANSGAVLPVSQSTVSITTAVKTDEQTPPVIMQANMQTELPTGLSHRAARIYADLQKAIEARKS